MSKIYIMHPLQDPESSPFTERDREMNTKSHGETENREIINRCSEDREKDAREIEDRETED